MVLVQKQQSDSITLQGWGLYQTTLWNLYFNMEKSFSLRFFAESQNLPLKFGKIRKNAKTPQGDSNLHSCEHKGQRISP